MNGTCGERIVLKGLYNTRDLGGYRTTDNRMVVSGRLYRSGALFLAELEDIKLFAGPLRLGTIIDFRTPGEQRQKPDPVIPGVTWISNPILDEETVGITFEEHETEEKPDPLGGIMKLAVSLNGQPERYIDQLYRDLILSDSAARRYGTFFDLLLAADDRAVLWHCTAGKDRVGIGTALLLAALGVDRETVIRDYERTNVYVEAEAAAVAARVLDQTGSKKAAECVQSLLMVSSVYLEDAFAAAERQSGSLERYLELRIGLTDLKRARLREKFLTLSEETGRDRETKGENMQ